jgi:7-carboxy-7-deazaguanine synthase
MGIKINEIFYSIQGESTYAGEPCVFIRLSECNLRCSYCDTTYAYKSGEQLEINQIITKIKEYNCNLVEVTGGEPLLQTDVVSLLHQLIDLQYDVLLETNGSQSIEDVPDHVIKIVDFKCPSSGMSDKNMWENIDSLTPFDEVKFVIGNKDDYVWAKSILKKYELDNKATVLFSPVFNTIDPRIIVEWILKDQLNVKFQLQLHKIIWDAQQKGV